MVNKDLKYSEIIEQMTLEEKTSLCDGQDFWHTEPIERLGIPSIMVSDGPHGLRKKDPEGKKSGLTNSVPAVCFPTACVTACSWDPSLLTEMGEALGDMCREEDVSVLLGPGINMKRSPLCGRNFEYFSEDPYLAGKLAAAFINGVQSKGVGTSLKHFAANSQETRRMSCDSVIDERALRELYLTAFEIAVKEAKPWTLMNSYNKINGEHGSENNYTQNSILRNEWGFDGVVMSDWGAVNNRVKGIRCGNDLEMPSSFGLNQKRLIEAVKNGELDEKYIDLSVDRILDLVFKAKEKSPVHVALDFDAQHELARKIAGNSMVLMKNDNNILPLKSGAKVAVIGEMAKNPRFQGAGSSLINPTKIENGLDSLKAAGVNVVAYEPGYCRDSEKSDSKLLNAAVNAAKSADIAVLFVGLTEAFDSEGFDRAKMAMPKNQDELVHRVASVNPNTVVVLAGGSAVSMPWLDEIKGLLNSYLNGQAGALAVADILTGKVNPSGKLAESYPCCEKATPAYRNFPGSPKSVEYRESIYIGYRYYDTFDKTVKFPFGFGLSYTRFEYSDIKVSKSEINDNEKITVTFKIKNVGDTAGAEIAQCYVRDIESTIYRPQKELKSFKKVWLEPGEETTVSLDLGMRAFSYYNVNIADWHVESGEFEILIGASSRDIRLSETVTVNSTSENVTVPDYRATAPDYYAGGDAARVSPEQFVAVLGRELPPSHRDETTPLTLENNIEDAKNTKWGSRIYNMITSIMKRTNKGPNAALMSAVATQTPIRCMISMSCGVFSPKAGEALLKILNDESGGKRQLLSCVPAIIKNIDKIMQNV